jgi:hypothetical protein
VDLDAIVPGVVSDIDGSVAYSTTDNAKTYNVIDEVAKRALCTGVVVITGGPGELSIYPRVPSRRRPIAKKS